MVFCPLNTYNTNRNVPLLSIPVPVQVEFEWPWGFDFNDLEYLCCNLSNKNSFNKTTRFSKLIISKFIPRLKP